MKKSRFTEEQIIAMLREQEAGAATAEERPHSKLGWMTPRDFARTITETTSRNAALNNGSALRPLATAINDGSDHDRTLVPAG